ncbi:MAG: NAD(P)-binding domain-containing protein [Chloroflexi bacterium]|nr:NAD(P)-binding domain-containing protein [Chloroflexota bacterium]
MKVLWITQRSEFHQLQALAAAPAELDVTMRTSPGEADLAPAEVLISEFHGIINKQLLNQAPNLRLILRIGASTHDIDLKAAAARNIVVSRQPVWGNIMVAEHCLMLMLALSKRFNEAQQAAHGQAGVQPARRTDENTFNYNWANLQGIGGIYEKTVAIIGMGDIGTELARRLKTFLPAAVLYNKRTLLPDALEAELSVQFADMDACLSEADFVVTLLPYSPQTDKLIDENKLALMKKTAFLVQVGSGSTIDDIALARRLENGQIAGAALDTFEYEPLPVDHPLLQLATSPECNVILTPHVAAATVDSTIRRRYEYSEVLRFYNNEPLKNQII